MVCFKEVNLNCLIQTLSIFLTALLIYNVLCSNESKSQLGGLSNFMMHDNIFSIKEISGGMEGLRDLTKKIANQKKTGNGFLDYKWYEQIARFLPAIPDYRGKSIPEKAVPLLDSVNNSLAYLGCTMKRYLSSDLDVCVEMREKAGLSTHLTFIGDSRLRRVVESLVELLRSANVSIWLESGQEMTPSSLLERNTKKDGDLKKSFSILKNNSPSLRVDFKWLAFYSWKQSNLFQNLDWKRIPSRKRRTLRASTLKYLKQIEETNDIDFLFMNGGIWVASSPVQEDVMDQIDYWGIYTVHELDEALKKISQKIPVLFYLTSPAKAPSNSTFSNIDFTSVVANWLGESRVRYLTNVQIWDSFLPIFYREGLDCWEVLKSDKDRMQHQNFGRCLDGLHSSRTYLRIAAQMILNSICNPYMNLPMGYC